MSYYRRDQKNKSRSADRSDDKKQKSAPVPKKNYTGLIKAFGCRKDDGFVQISFTLPVDRSEKAQMAAGLFAEQMGLKNVKIKHMEQMGEDLTFFVVYAQSDIEIDMSKIVVPVCEHPVYSFDDVNSRIKEEFDRRLVVLGACIGADGQQSGMDTIFNIKGYLGDPGLEAYPMLDAINLRSKVHTSELITEITARRADVVIVSRVVAQKDQQIKELKKILDELDSANDVPKNLIKIYGGPRVSHEEVHEIGYDAGFGPGTPPGRVASFIVSEMLKRD